MRIYEYASSRIAFGVLMSLRSGRSPSTEAIVSTATAAAPIRIEPATDRRRFLSFPAPNARAVTIAKPLPMLLAKTVRSSKIDAHAPMAAREFSPRKLPTIAVSAAL